jgi:integrase
MAAETSTPSVPRLAPALTAKKIADAKPRAAAYELTDGGARGLQLRVTPLSKDGRAGGTKSFRWRARGLGRTITLGPWSMEARPGHLTLQQARRWFERLKDAHRAGQLEATVAELELEIPRRKAKAPAAAPVAPTAVLFRTVAEEFYKDDIMKSRKRPEAVRDVLDRDLLPVLGERPYEAITTLECRDLVKRVVRRPAPVHAGKVLAILKQLMGYAQASGLTDRNPSAPLKARHLGVESNTSDRWLSDQEIPLFWKALDATHTDPRPDSRGVVQRRLAMAPASAAGLRLALLTGVRSGELLLARWEHVDLKAATWTIPVENQKLTPKQAKKAKPFVVPLSPQAVELFKQLQVEAGKVKVGPTRSPSPWVMASAEADDGHYTDKALGRAMRRLFEGTAPLLTLPGGDASPHDLRRTMRTHLGKLRVSPHITERCLNHSLGRIVQTYDQGDYIEERREALELWSAYVDRLVTGKTAKVVPLAEARAR